MLRKVGAVMDAVEFFACPTRSRVDARLRPAVRRQPRAARWRLTGWRFNAWAKYDDWQPDALVPGASARSNSACPLWQPGMVLEGGSIDVNGAGLLLTTEECLLSAVQARNPGDEPRGHRADSCATYLGIRRVIWLRNGIAGDDTHGHVDDLARFVGPMTVVVASERDRSDANYEPLRENTALLRAAGLRVVKLPMPRPLVFAGQRLPASYANFYIANGLVLVPTFNDPSRPHRAQHAGAPVSGSRRHRHQLYGADLGPGRAALHDPAATRHGPAGHHRRSGSAGLNECPPRRPSLEPLTIAVRHQIPNDKIAPAYQKIQRLRYRRRRCRRCCLLRISGEPVRRTACRSPGFQGRPAEARATAIPARTPAPANAPATR